jgi:hypothetical protein
VVIAFAHNLWSAKQVAAEAIVYTSIDVSNLNSNQNQLRTWKIERALAPM